MTTLKPIVNPAAWEVLDARPFRKGNRVEILVGGHKGEFATVRRVGDMGWHTLTLDTGMLAGGFKASDLRRVAA